MKLKHTILLSSFTNQTKNILIFYFLKIKCVEKKKSNIFIKAEMSNNFAQKIMLNNLYIFILVYILHTK